MIDWTNPSDKVSQYFSVNEAIYLPRWDRMANETDGLDDNAKTGLVNLFEKMDQIRELLGVPIIVHVGFRSVSYNLLVNGAADSSHIARMLDSGICIAACDFHPLLSGLTQGEKCDKGRVIIEPYLESLGLRIENNPPMAPWIHLDSRPVLNGARIFNP